MSTEETKENSNFKFIARDFANSTTAHGFSHIVSSRYFVVRLLWVVIIIACQIGLYFQIRPLVEEYFRKPTKTKIILEEEKRQVFPVITVCNTNIVMSSMLEDLLNNNYFKDNKDSFTDKKRRRRRNAGGKYENPTTESRDDYENLTTQSPNEYENPTTQSRDEYENPTTQSRDDHKNPTTESHDEYKNPTTQSYDTEDEYDRTKYWAPPDDDSGFNVNDKDAQVYQNKQNILENLANIAHHDQTDVFLYGHQLYDMILDCKWKDYYDCTSDVWWQPIWHWRYGNCYSFNSGMNASVKLQTVSGTGPYNGLSLTLALNQSEYVNSFMTDTAGIVLHIGEQGARVEPYLNGHKLAPNFAHYIGISKKRIRRADPFNNDSCIQHSTKHLGRRSVTQPVIKKYSRHACQDMCEASEQLKHCGCTSYWLPSLTSNRTCDELDTDCTYDIEEARINGSLHCLKECRLPCDEVKYMIQSSATAYPTKKERIENPEYYRKYIEDNVLKVSLSFASTETEVISNEMYYFIENLLGDIGGQLGLWSGVSALTVVELFFFLWQGVYVLFRYCGLTAAKTGQKIGPKVNKISTNN